MKINNIIHFILFFILGIFLFYVLKGVCGCKIEGNIGATGPSPGRASGTTVRKKASLESWLNEHRNGPVVEELIHEKSADETAEKRIAWLRRKIGELENTRSASSSQETLHPGTKYLLSCNGGKLTATIE